MSRIVEVFVVFVSLFIAATAGATVPVTLKGSPASMQRQNTVAKQAGFLFVGSVADLEDLVEDGRLMPVEGNGDYVVKPTVSHRVARPELRLFIERLAEQYRAATGEQLVVTSLTRPQSRQPGNSHELSVHPTGMAVDLRVSRRRASRAWLEAVLLKLEGQGLLDVTRERWPPHYHVALFPDAYRTYVEGMIGVEAVAAALAGESSERAADEPATPEEVVATVSLGTSAPAENETSRPWPWLLGVTVAILAVFLVRRQKRSGIGSGADVRIDAIRNEPGISGPDAG